MPVDIKEAEPNAFYGGTSKMEWPLFLRRRCTPIDVQTDNTTKWMMGLTEIGGPLDENRFLWLKQSPNDSANNGVLSVVRNGDSVILGVEWPGSGRLGMSILSKSNGSDSSEAVTECDRVALSTASGITVEYDRLSGDLIIYYQSDLMTQRMNERNDQNENVHKEDVADGDAMGDGNDGDGDGVQIDESAVIWNVDTESKVVYRAIDVEGAITVFYSDSSQRRVFPDSEIWTKSKDSKWIKVKVNGDCVVDGEVLESVKIKMATTTDSDSMTSIITRTDNVMVLEQQNGDRVIQCPDSMDILVESEIGSDEWKGHKLSQWIESIGVDRQSAEQIANDKLKQDAEARKCRQKLVRFQLKNDSIMPTVIVYKAKDQQRTECIFDNQFRAVFGRPNSVSDRGTVTVEHRRFGTLTFGTAKGRESEALFVPISSTQNGAENESKSDAPDPLEFRIDLKAENPSISCSDSSRIAFNGEHSGTILEPPKQSENKETNSKSSNRRTDEMDVRPAPRTKVEIPSVLGESMECGTANDKDSGSVSISDVGDVVVDEDEHIENEPENEAESVPTTKVSGTANVEDNASEQNVGYFSNEPFLREFEISCSVAEMLAECHPSSGLQRVRTLNALCTRLRAMISAKNASDSTVSTLSLNEVEEMVTELVPSSNSSTDRIDINTTEHLHRLLCSIGLKLDAEHRCYVAEKCTILIDGGICFMASKLDEFHVNFKKQLVIERDTVSEMTTMTAAMRLDEDRDRDAGDITVDTDSRGDHHGHHRTDRHSDFRPKSISSPDADLLSRCLSHCSCCPPQSPQRATRMDYLGRTRDHFISIDDLQKYPAPVPQRKLNRKYIESEASVERRVRTSSTFNSTMASQDAAIPTVLIQPASFDFGALRIGNVYRFTASITNHGHSQSRFHLSIASQSDPEHPVHIKAYHKMGAIAPGISIALQIELCSEIRCGPYSNIVTVKTKKHIFEVDVTAHFVKRRDPQQSLSTNKRVVCLGRKC